MKIQLINRSLAKKVADSSSGLLEAVGVFVISTKAHDQNSGWKRFEIGNSGSLEILLAGFKDEHGSSDLVTLVIAPGKWLFADPEYRTTD